MAPTRSKKRKSSESTSSVDIQDFPAPPQLAVARTRSPVRTPSRRSPIKKPKMGITVAQKQALIDNLQLEITERARKLRAQYSLQAQGLRSRIEIRINRIPTALRKAKLGELFLKQTASASRQVAGNTTQKAKSPTKNLLQAGQSSRRSPSPQRAFKRQSDAISADKENEDVENPKKRPRAAPEPPARTTSRAKVQPSQVLSPRSANSQALPRSTTRTAGASPGKSYLARPVSPLKPAAPAPSGGASGILTNMVEKAKSTRGAAGAKKTEISAGAGRGKRIAAPVVAPKAGRGRASTISDSSDNSNSTVIKKPLAAAKKEPAAKKTMMGTIRGIGAKKAPAAKAAPAASTATGGRVLRKRN